MGLLEKFQSEAAFWRDAEQDRLRADIERVHANEQDRAYERARAYNRNRPMFIGVRGCDKCGNFERHETHYKTHDYVNSKGEVFTDEWLARRCNGCNYRWNEAVVTA